MPTLLEMKIRELIYHNGPVSVSDYFSLCLADPEFGYYKIKDPFGENGDFTTAPEISQLFGEMIGIFLVQSWQAQNPTTPVRLVEIGPGRGTLMSDVLRVIKKIAPELFETLSVHLVETSPKLTDIQAQTLKQYNIDINWHHSFEDVPDGFILLAANELFDAVPIRQFVKTSEGFRERTVTLDSDDCLIFSSGIVTIDPQFLPPNHKEQPDGTIIEIAPARANIMASIATRLKAQGGSALVIDYGYFSRDFGDTLQAVFAHRYDPPLAHPGLADLTSHVDFETLLGVAHSCGTHIHGVMHQGDFLVGLGMLQRAMSLGQNKDETTQNEIRTAVERLAGYGEGNMGELFKVLAISGSDVTLTPFITKANEPPTSSELN